MELRNIEGMTGKTGGLISKILTRKVSSIMTVIAFVISISFLLVYIPSGNLKAIIISGIATGIYTIALLILLYDLITLRKKK